MSLLLILRKIWSYRLVTVPIVVLVIVGAFYVIAIQAPTYESSGTYILVNPPAPPTDAQIARDPALAGIHGDNPYTRYSDPAVLVQVLASRLSSDQVRLSLARQGVDQNYIAQPSAEFGFSAPILQITGTGTTPTAAVKTTNLVGQALAHQLNVMQEAQGVDKTYWIKTEAVVPATDAKLKASGKLRSLVALLILGTILLFIAISILDAVSALRGDWKQSRSAEHGTDPDASSAPPLTPHRDSASGKSSSHPRSSAGWDRPSSVPDPDLLLPWTREARR